MQHLLPSCFPISGVDRRDLCRTSPQVQAWLGFQGPVRAGCFVFCFVLSMLDSRRTYQPMILSLTFFSSCGSYLKSSQHCDLDLCMLHVRPILRYQGRSTSMRGSPDSRFQDSPPGQYLQHPYRLRPKHVSTGQTNGYSGAAATCCNHHFFVQVGSILVFHNLKRRSQQL